MSKQHLIEALERYQEYEEYAQKLKHLVEEDDSVEIIMHQSTLTALQAIEYALAIRIHDVSEQIEAHDNQALDNFVRRQIR